MKDQPSLTLAILFACVAWPAWATFETETLFSHKAWLVEMTHDTSDGDMWCSAQTTNRAGQTLSLTAYGPGSIALFVFDGSWSLRPRPVRFLVDIDYERWVIDGTAGEISVSMLLPDEAKSVRFLEQIAQGRAVAVMNQDERRLASFTLAGSKAALLKLIECGRAIAPGDPFTTRSDPF